MESRTLRSGWLRTTLRHLAAWRPGFRMAPYFRAMASGYRRRGLRLLCGLVLSLFCLGVGPSQAFTGTYTNTTPNFCLPTNDSFDWGECYNFNWQVIGSSFAAVTTLSASTQSIQTELTSEIARATAAEATKAPLTGGGASGTWGISISGLAATASALANNPTDCSGTQFVNGMSANGTLSCAETPEEVGETPYYAPAKTFGSSVTVQGTLEAVSFVGDGATLAGPLIFNTNTSAAYLEFNNASGSLSSMTWNFGGVEKALFLVDLNGNMYFDSANGEYHFGEYYDIAPTFDFNTRLGTFADPAAFSDGLMAGAGTPLNKLDVNGGMVVGSDYVGVATAPVDGVAVSGNIGAQTTYPDYPLDVNGGANVLTQASAGSLKIYSNLTVGTTQSVVVSDSGRYCTFPGLTKTLAGGLVAVYRCGTGHTDPPFDGAYYYKVSLDSGITWGVETLLYNPPANYNGQDIEVATMPDGHIVATMFYSTASGVTGSFAGNMIYTATAAVTGNTLSWGVPILVATSFDTVKSTPVAATSGKPVWIAATNKIMMPIYGEGEAAEANHTTDVSVMFSADGGLTWADETSVYHGVDLVEQPSEMNCVVLATARIACVMRMDTAWPGPGYYEVHSDDNGATWSTPFQAIQQMTPGRPTLTLLDSGALVLLARHDGAIAAARRHYYWTSWDGGRSWSEAALFDPALDLYNSMVRISSTVYGALAASGMQYGDTAPHYITFYSFEAAASTATAATFMGGPVGIGTVSPCSTCTLHVAGGLYVTGNAKVEGATQIGPGSYWTGNATNGYRWNNAADNATLLTLTNGGNATLFDGLVASGQIVAGGTMTVKGAGFSVGTSTLVVAGGRVGIGTTDPSERLQVSGGKIYPAGTGTGSGITFDHGAIYEAATTQAITVAPASGGTFSVIGHVDISNAASAGTCTGGTLVAGSSDNVGAFSTGAGGTVSATSCNIVFGSTFKNTPFCMAQWTDATRVTPYVYSVNTSSVTFAYGACSGGCRATYLCVGY